MEKDVIEKLIKLREFVIKHHRMLDGGSNPGSAIVKQSTVAHVYESTIRSIDALLESHVKFK
jgi:hypothetical protein